jgi:hypothetical protein
MARKQLAALWTQASREQLTQAARALSKPLEKRQQPLTCAWSSRCKLFGVYHSARGARRLDGLPPTLGERYRTVALISRIALSHDVAHLLKFDHTCWPFDEMLKDITMRRTQIREAGIIHASRDGCGRACMHPRVCLRQRSVRPRRRRATRT